jgi:hypothetical protein
MKNRESVTGNQWPVIGKETSKCPLYDHGITFDHCITRGNTVDILLCLPLHIVMGKKDN